MYFIKNGKQTLTYSLLNFTNKKNLASWPVLLCLCLVTPGLRKILSQSLPLHSCSFWGSLTEHITESLHPLNSIHSSMHILPKSSGIPARDMHRHTCNRWSTGKWLREAFQVNISNSSSFRNLRLRNAYELVSRCLPTKAWSMNLRIQG